MAKQAQSHASRPATFLTGSPFTSNLTSEDLGALTRTHGYFSSSSAQTFDAKGNANVDSVFRVEKTLNKASDSTVGMVNGDRDAGDGVHWDDGTSRLFAGHTLADQRIVLDTSAQILCGRAVAPNAPVKLDTNAFSDNCTGINGEGSSPTEFAGLVGQNYNVPEPSTGLLLLAVGVIGVGARMKSTFRASSESL
jgi:type VI secretion system secreted protein VgrG